jgi:molybdenum cofactor guanylyltransferase
MAKDLVTGLVLAGGRGSRMGGADKGLALWHGTPLALHALQRLQTQLPRCAISANRNVDTYAQWGVPVWADASDLGSYSGPLAAFATALLQSATPYVATVPCDTPHFPADLVARLHQALQQARSTNPSRVAIACIRNTDHTLRPQPVFCLLHTSLHADLHHYVQNGGRKVMDWLTRHNPTEVPFDDAHAFRNLNTVQELADLQSAGG